jgi:ClpP class serine protease
MNKQQLLLLLTSSDLAIDPSYLEAGMSVIQSLALGESLEAVGEPFKIDSIALTMGEKVEGSYRAYARDNIGIVNLVGPITPSATLMTQLCGIGTPLDAFLKDTKMLVDDPSIDTIFIYNTSPGGSVEGINEGANLLAKWGKEKEIVTYTTSQNASASYWLTSKAGKIFGDATAFFGSIGVMASTYKSKDENTLTFISSKSPMKNVDPATDEGRVEVLKRIDAIADIFINSVAEGRGVSVETVEETFGKGGVMIAKAALEAGMIDGLSSFEELFQKYSTEAPTNNQTFYMYKGEDTMSLTLQELKAKFPQVYQAAVDEATAPIQATVTERDGQIVALTSQITTLEGQVASAGTENATLSNRLTALERENEMQKAKAAEKELKDTAKSIETSLFQKSNLPDRALTRISKLVSYESFVNDKGVLDAAGYEAALTAEIADWVSIAGNTSSVGLSGLSSASDTSDDALSRMSGYVGISAK